MGQAARELSAWRCLTLALGACPPSRVLNALLPRDGYVLHEEVAYGDKERQVFDKRYLSRRGVSGAALRGFLGLAGAYAFDPVA